LAKVSEPIFRITAKNISTIYDAFTADVDEYVVRMRTLGVSADEIFRQLGDNLEDRQDLFQRFKGALESEIDNITGVTAQAESNSIYESGAMLKWELDPTVREHCDDCVRNSGDGAKTFEQWSAIGLPGFGNTACLEYCKCTLVRAN
jgi:hypothetical protein